MADHDLQSWMKKQNIYDNDLYSILSEQGIEDPTEDFQDYTQSQWDVLWRKGAVERAKELKDQKAKVRLEKKMKKIEKYWRQQSGIKITSIKKRKGKKKKKKKKKQDPKSATNIEMQQNIEHGTLSDDEIEEYVTIKINVKSLKYNKLNDKYSMTLGDCMISENNPLRQIVKIEIDGKHIDTNISNDSNQLSSNEIDTVLDEIEMDEDALKFDSKRIALNVNDKLLICGFVRHIQESAVVSDDVIGVITVYIHSGNYANNLVTIGIGGGGCRLLHEMYNNQYAEYQSISSDPCYKYTKIASNASCYFDINNENKCKAKSIFVDLEEKVVQKIFAFDKQRDDMSIYNMSDSCVGIGSATNNWAKGHYTNGCEVIDATMDSIRLQLEKNGIPKAFQIMHSMAGGTGGGLSTLIMMRCCNDFNIKIPIHSFSLFPSIWQAEGMQFTHWPINVILALSTMNEYVDGVIAIDFDCLFKICSNKFNMSKPKGQDLNFVAYQAISDIISLCPTSYTDMFRYLCPKPSDIEWECDYERERYYYSEKMKYYTVSHVPIYAQYTEYGSKHHNPYNMDTYKNKMIEMSNIDTFGNTNTNQIISKLFDDEYNFSSHFKIGQGTNISTVMIHRGQNLETQKEKILKASQRMLRRKTNCMNNIPLNLFINSSPMFTGRNATMVSNSTTIGKYFERIHAYFMKLWRRRTHHRLYLDEGMDAMEIDQASENVKSIIDSYKQNHN
eukprot:39890_1